MIQSKWIEIHRHKIHYLEVGQGDPILFVHGNPTSSYLWRNILPYTKNLGRCLAIDLIGMGASDKPPITYTLVEHLQYFIAFIEALDLKNITFVLHDWGSVLGFYYALTKPDHVKALVFMEAILKVNESYEDFEDGADMFRRLRTKGLGQKMILEDNFFLDVVLPGGTVKGLAPEIINHYKTPYPSPKDRLPIWQWVQEISIDGHPQVSTSIINACHDFLKESPLPKLLLYGKPGALIKEADLIWCQKNIPRLSSIYIGEAGHFLQEDQADPIGQALVGWLKGL